MGIAEAEADRQKAEVWGVKKLRARALFQGLGKESLPPIRGRDAAGMARSQSYIQMPVFDA